MLALCYRSDLKMCPFCVYPLFPISTPDEAFSTVLVVLCVFWSMNVTVAASLLSFTSSNAMIGMASQVMGSRTNACQRAVPNASVRHSDTADHTTITNFGTYLPTDPARYPTMVPR